MKPLDRTRQTAAATLAYAALTVMMTWPLAGGLSHDIPGDFGDPLLNCWILAWDAGVLLLVIFGKRAPARLVAFRACVLVQWRPALALFGLVVRDIAVGVAMPVRARQ